MPQRTDAILAVEGDMTRILRAVRAAVQQNASRFSPELQPSGYLILGFIVKHHPVPPGEIVAQMGFDKSAVSRQLRVLRDLGFVTSVPDPDDRRASLFAPTDAASERLADIRRDAQQDYADLFDDWTDDDLHQFARLLGAFTDRIERR
ncbi:MAG: MarR family transcriptional regulator [Herbiconiux sp.]|nr:MarR family transcriptional regulator [Herbiconiux sp.]